MSLVVAALGGNALVRRGEDPDPEEQERNVRRASRAIAGIARDHDVVVVHGSGPQVGLLALRSEAGPQGWREPLDVLGAEIEGMIGYLLQRELHRHLPGRPVVSLLTQVAVDAGDPAFGRPTKPIGPIYGEAEARGLAEERGWTVAPDGKGWRRVVASPEPKGIVELESIRALVRLGHVVVAAGGGGVPVLADGNGGLRGVEAVVDKDLSAALLATELGADALILLTDVDAVYLDWPARERKLAETTPDELRAADLPPGSMGPKAEAAARFVERTGRWAVIGAMEDAAALAGGRGGTRVALTRAEA